jgi:rod shape-determining protein MreC
MFVDLPFRIGSWVSDSLTDRSQLLEENQSLDASLRDAEFALQQLEALRVENARLRDLLGASQRLEDRRLVAEILSVELLYRQRFMVNRGSADGVFVGQAVLDRHGVVGQVVSVGQWTSEVILITDADHALPVVVNRSGLRTIAVGTGDQQRLRLPYLTSTADIEVGDLLVSSGLGAVFPAGYPVARVLSMQTQPGQAFADVLAEPVSALDRDQEVLLLFNDTPTAAEMGGVRNEPTGDEQLSVAELEP